MSCPNCGARVEHAVTLSDEKIPVPTENAPGGVMWLSIDVWERWACVGLKWFYDPTFENVSPPCGWLRWIHEDRVEIRARAEHALQHPGGDWSTLLPEVRGLYRLYAAADEQVVR